MQTPGKADEVFIIIKGDNKGLYECKKLWREKRFAEYEAGEKACPEIGAAFKNFQSGKPVSYTHLTLPTILLV